MGQIVTISSEAGTEIEITDPYVLISADWGDADVEAQLATGPDIVGAVAGARTRLTREAVLEIGVSEQTGSAFTVSTAAIDALIAEIQEGGGTIRRQQSFRDGDSEALELEVLAARPAHQPGTIRHKGYESVIYTFVCNPGWLADEELLAQDLTFTDSVKRLAVTPRGNLPGPGRVVLIDNASTPRRFGEIGGAFTQTPRQVEYLAADFTAVAGSSVADTDALGGTALEVSPVLAVWQTVGVLEGLAHQGGFRVRVRGKGGDTDASFIQRVSWRAGSGPWQDLEERPEMPDAASYYDLDAGALRHYDETETIDVRVDVLATETATGPYRLDALTLTPTDLYVVGRGLEVTEPDVGTTAFDDLAGLVALDQLDARVAPTGEAWDETPLTLPQWIAPYDDSGYVLRANSADNATTLTSGQFALLGATDYPEVDVTVEGEVFHDGAKDRTVMLGAVARYVDASNWVMAVMRIRRSADKGKRTPYVSLFKRDGGGAPVQLENRQMKSGSGLGIVTSHLMEGTMRLTIDTAGAYAVWVGSKGGDANSLVFEGTDADFAQPAGSHREGQVGAYSLVQGSKGYTHLRLFKVAATIPSVVRTDVVRADGIGVFASAEAYAADADGSDPQPFSPQGPRIVIPPTAGEITAKVRSSDSDSEADAGAGDDTGIAVYHRPGFVSLAP